MPLAGLTSDDQTTAADWTKFGFHVEEADDVFSALRAAPTLRFVGVSAHIGTQITDPTGYHRLLDHLLSLTERARAMGLTTDRLNIGGGFPVRFLTEFEWRRFTGRLLARLRGQVPLRDAVTWNDLPLGYAHLGREEKGEPQWIGKAYWTPHPESTMLEQVLEHRTPDGQATVDRLKEVGSPRLIVEPGRSLVGPAGVTLTRVTGTKEVLGHHVVSLDMGINNHGTNLIAPDIFSAAVLPRAPDDRPAEAYLAGRLCFSGDMISKAKVLLNRLPAPGERFAIYHTGAYGADHFASHSCGFPRPAKVAIREDGTAELWRRPDQFEDVFGAPDDLLDAS
jgi:diaminopimelate decarboxylase